MRKINITMYLSPQDHRTLSQIYTDLKRELGDERVGSVEEVKERIT